MSTAVLTRRPTRLLPATWPVTFLVPGLVVWWALGLAPVARPLVAAPILASLMLQRRVRLPHAFGVWAVFLALVALSGLQLPVGKLPAFGLRMSEYLAATVLMVYVHNLPAEARGESLRRVLFAGWLVLVGLGVLALLFPTGELPSLSRAVIPRGIADDPWIRALTTPSLAQVHVFLGFPLPRPAAPFAYTNGWGSAFALLLPFAVATLVTGRPAERRMARIGLVVGVVPAVVSVNRTLWGSAAVSLLFLAATAADPTTRRVLRRVVLLIASLLVGLMLTQLGELAQQRLDTPHSNAARADLAQQASQRVLDRPLLGYGAPQEFEGSRTRPPVGTQGQLWSITISHGIPATGAFLAFFVLAFRRSQAHGTGLWTRASLVAAAVQLPFYGMLGGQLLILMVAVGAALADAQQSEGGDVWSRAAVARN